MHRHLREDIFRHELITIRNAVSWDGPGYEKQGERRRMDLCNDLTALNLLSIS